jgi:hypothetical protein
VDYPLFKDGNIDLVGESQLLEKRHTPTQFGESILEQLAQDLSKETNKERKIVIVQLLVFTCSAIQGVSNNIPYTIKKILKMVQLIQLI